MFNRAEIVDHQLVDVLRAERAPEGPARDAALPVLDGVEHAPSGHDLLELYDSQVTCRQLDLVAREMRARGESFYTIASAGHEGNAVVGRLLRHTDPAFLHYRSGALMAERARKLPAEHARFIDATLMSLAASRDEPIAGGRHKVWGSRPLWVLPQTSTIASHLPKAVGTALALDRARRIGALHPELARDSVVVCSFGDASANHSTSQGAINAACFATHQRLPVPLLLVCEDNQLGISVPTPSDWIERSLGARPGLSYVQADGLDIVDAYCKTAEAVALCRKRRQPVLLHLRVVRMLGHAGSDMEASYRSIDQIESTERLDPVLATARRLVALRLRTPEQVLARYQEIGAAVRDAATRVARAPRLTSAAEVLEPLAPLDEARVNAQAAASAPVERRREAFGEALPEQGAPKHMA
ncbi:MAG: hypothetical protein KC503_15515, partial [Myxococcales bacterium]|nr:hypothetical protein [Myxococcales bacterium]